MADDGEQEQLLVVTATAEPDECSRWAMICLLGCGSVTLLGLAFYLTEDFESCPAPSIVLLLSLLFSAVGFYFCALCIILVCEQFSGGNPAGVMNVDRLFT